MVGHFCENIFDLKFEEEPNYGKLRHMLVCILMKKNQAPDMMYDWSKFKQSTNHRYAEALNN